MEINYHFTRREHWVSKFDKKLSLIPVVGTATNLTKLFAKLFFKILENLLPPVYRPLKSQRVVRAITSKQNGTYIFRAIPFWFLLKAMYNRELRQQQVGSSLQRSDAAKRNWDSIVNLRDKHSFFTSKFRSKTEELHHLKWSDPQKFEIESLTNKQLIETSLPTLNDLTNAYTFLNKHFDCLAFQEAILTAFGERIALYYPDTSSPPLYLEKNDPLQRKIIEAWKQSLPRMSEKLLVKVLE